MSTRSNILRENSDSSYDCIYCHFDGYPSNNGRILLENYTDPSKVDALIALGDLSSLRSEIGTKHNFDDSPDNECNAYGRDRGETGTEPHHYDTAEELSAMLEKAWTEWVYTFRVADGKWYFTNNPSPTWFKLCGTDQRETAELTMEAIERDGE